MIHSLMPINKIICGNALIELKKIPDESIDCIITSPPYWGLRDYGEDTRIIWDGDKNCEHQFEIENPENLLKEYQGDWDRPSRKEYKKVGEDTKCLVCGKNFKGKLGQKFCSTKCLNTLSNEQREKLLSKKQFCQKCGAWYGQLGLEPTFDLYIEHLLQITAELKRVLKKTGVFFLNWGDCYQDKSLCLQNYRGILRMIDEQGWILRNTIIWHKPNAMPSSVKDRFSSRYEPVFMLVKNRKYYFDLDAVRIPHKYPEDVARRIRQDREAGVKPFQKGDLISLHINKFNYHVRDAEKKSEQCPQFKLTDTEKIALKYGYDPEGICPICGRTWKRHASPNSADRKEGLKREFIPCVKRHTSIPQDQAESFGSPRARYWREKHSNFTQKADAGSDRNFDGFHWTSPYSGKNPGDLWTISTQPCPKEYRGIHFATFPEKLVKPMILAGAPKNGMVLDPFCGLGTVGVVAKKLGRNFIGIEISKKYCDIAEKRLLNVPKRLEMRLEIFS